MSRKQITKVIREKLGDITDRTLMEMPIHVNT
jgi:hypothetical protein